MNRKLKYLKEEINQIANPEKAKGDLRFFKTSKGAYAEGDAFLGIAVPVLRKLGKKYLGIELDEIQELLYSKYNEERLLALMILVEEFERGKGDRKIEEEIYRFYVQHIKRVNNWNLVDLSARPIVGQYLRDKDRAILMDWGRSENLWLRRISIVATWYFIKKGEFKDTLEIAKLLLNDKEDLIHKAAGWMLRELGKMNESVLKDFLKKHQKEMPRTMLRYAIERLNVGDREQFMKGIYL